MKHSILIISILLNALISQAQNLTGKITDVYEQPVAFANIILMETDSTFITGTISDENGIFELISPEKNALLKITYIGYTDKVISVKPHQTETGNILLAENTQLLGEIIVKGLLPTTHIKGEAMVTHITGTILKKAGTAEDVLVKIPGIMQKGEDINVFGRGKPLVYINSREIHDLSELNQLTSENIRSVEVITNPGARYDKSVKAVIKIHTKKKADDGFGFGDRANISYNDKTSYKNQLDLNYRRDKLDIAGMISYTDKYNWRKNEAIQNTYLENYTEQKMNTYQEISSQQIIANTAVNYSLNPDQSFGGNYRYSRYPNADMDMNIGTTIYEDHALVERSTSLINTESPETYHEANAYYNGKVGTWNIDVNTTVLRNKETVTGLTQEKIHTAAAGDEENTVHTDTETRNTFYAAKMILSSSVFGGEISLGGEFTHTLRTSLYENLEGIVENDDSKIKERLFSGFLEYSREINIVRVQAGLRFENVNFNYYKSGIYQDEQSKNYNHFFPSFSLSVPVKDIETQLSYTSDITRPIYEMLRNRIDYVNRYTYESGNPLLKPSTSHIGAFKSSYKWLLLYADLQHIKNDFIFSSETYSTENPGIALLRQENAPSYNAMNLMVNAAPKIGNWSPQWSFEIYKQWYKVDAPGLPENNKLSLDRASLAIRWKNSLDLPAGFTLSADINWEGKTDRSNISYKATWWSEASLYKEFFNRRLTLLLQANDIFNTYRNKQMIYYGKIRTMSMDQRYSWRSIGLTVHYKFNIPASKYKGTGAGETQKGRL